MENEATCRTWMDYDPVADVLTIEGIRYDRELFRGMGLLPSGTWIRIVERRDGVITLTHINDCPTCSGPFGWRDMHDEAVPPEVTITITGIDGSSLAPFVARHPDAVAKAIRRLVMRGDGTEPVEVHGSKPSAIREHDEGGHE